MGVAKGYKQTEIGLIPVDWELKKFTDCAELRHGFQFREEHFSNTGIKVTKIGSLVDNGGLDFKDATYIPAEQFNLFSRFTLNKGDVLMALTGATLGKVSKVDVDDVILQNYRVGNFLNKENSTKEYIHCLLLSKYIQKTIKKLVNEAAQPNLGKGDFDKFIVPLPPTKTEQTAIATALSDADALITSLEKLIAKKRNIKQGAMQQLLTGKKRLPGFEQKKGHKRTELGLIPNDWDVKEFVEVMDGFSSGQTPYRAIPEYYKGEIPWITSGELNYNVITDTIEKITIEGVRDANLKMIPKGTFLFAITGLEAAGTRGSCAITGIEATTNQSCMALYPKKGLLITPYLYYYYLRYGNELAFKYCQGTKQQSFTGGIVKKLPIIIPPTVEEQVSISSILSDMDREINSLNIKLEKYRQIKSGMMQNLLTGKIRLV